MARRASFGGSRFEYGRGLRRKMFIENIGFSLAVINWRLQYLFAAAGCV
jgi:hypothetical protein